MYCNWLVLKPAPSPTATPILQRAHSAAAAAGCPVAAGFQSRQRHCCCWVAAVVADDFVAADGFVVAADVAADAGVACSANAVAADDRTTAVADYTGHCCCCR